MNKYYTPIIEEFHIGFEYEINNIKLNNPSTFKNGAFSDNWKKMNSTERHLNGCKDIIKELISTI